MRVRSAGAKSILSKTSGFIAQAGFTHSLTPARNCTFGCTYCYVPTMGIYGGLKPEDWNRWGQFTTYKSNAPELLRRELRSSDMTHPLPDSRSPDITPSRQGGDKQTTNHRIYCSPLVDPYQPAEAEEQMMPRILDALLETPPRVFTIQTRGPLILRDLDRLRTLSLRTTLRVSFSITTNREDVRRLYEPHCASFEERLDVVRALREAEIETYATLAPLLACDPEVLARAALEASHNHLIGDPLHIRATKRHGATTRAAAFQIGAVHDHGDYFEAGHQARMVEQIDAFAREAGFTFTTGPSGFARLAL
jgi:DNA repair photolyase